MTVSWFDDKLHRYTERNFSVLPEPIFSLSYLSDIVSPAGGGGVVLLIPLYDDVVVVVCELFFN
jgi:hypothetical protein